MGKVAASFFAADGEQDAVDRELSTDAATEAVSIAGAPP
jgi:hypothetical protein